MYVSFLSKFIVLCASTDRPTGRRKWRLFKLNGWWHEQPGHESDCNPHLAIHLIWMHAWIFNFQFQLHEHSCPQIVNFVFLFIVLHSHSICVIQRHNKCKNKLVSLWPVGATLSESANTTSWLAEHLGARTAKDNGASVTTEWEWIQMNESSRHVKGENNNKSTEKSRKEQRIVRTNKKWTKLIKKKASYCEITQGTQLHHTWKQWWC
jgi:hypothetical protein